MSWLTVYDFFGVGYLSICQWRYLKPYLRICPWRSLESDLSAKTVNNLTTLTAVDMFGTMSAKFLMYWKDVLKNMKNIEV